MNYQSASVIPVSIHQGEKYYYFTIENDGTLTTFGGSKHPSDKDLPENTAARKLSEKSNGVFGEYLSIHKKLSNGRQSGNRLIRNKRQEHICYIFHFEPKDVTSDFEENMEKKKFIAINEVSLKKAIDNRKWSLKGYPLKECVIGTLKKARREQAL